MKNKRDRVLVLLLASLLSLGTVVASAPSASAATDLNSSGLIDTLTLTRLSDYNPAIIADAPSPKQTYVLDQDNQPTTKPTAAQYTNVHANPLQLSAQPSGANARVMFDMSFSGGNDAAGKNIKINEGDTLTFSFYTRDDVVFLPPNGIVRNLLNAEGRVFATMTISRDVISITFNRNAQNSLNVRGNISVELEAYNQHQPDPELKGRLNDGDKAIFLDQWTSSFGTNLPEVSVVVAAQWIKDPADELTYSSIVGSYRDSSGTVGVPGDPNYQTGLDRFLWEVRLNQNNATHNSATVDVKIELDYGLEVLYDPALWNATYREGPEGLGAAVQRLSGLDAFRNHFGVTNFIQGKSSFSFSIPKEKIDNVFIDFNFFAAATNTRLNVFKAYDYPTFETTEWDSTVVQPTTRSGEISGTTRPGVSMNRQQNKLDGSLGYWFERSGLTVKTFATGIVPAPGYVHLYKVLGDTTTGLNGVTFTLYDAETDQPLSSGVTHSETRLNADGVNETHDGFLEFAPLTPGKAYYLKESRAPGSTLPGWVEINPDRRWDFTITSEIEAHGVVIPIANPAKPVDIKVKKVWQDANPPDGAEVRVTLLSFSPTPAPGVWSSVRDRVGRPVRLTLNAANNWEGTFINQPRYDLTGQLIKYSVREDQILNYTSVVTPTDGATADGDEPIELVVTNTWKLDTEATDETDGDHQLASEGGTIVDKVTYTGLDPTKRYVIDGKLMERKQITKPDGTLGTEAVETGISESTEFTPATADGFTELRFTVPTVFNGQEVDGKTLVAFEKLYELRDGFLVAAHEDINDGAQTVSVNYDFKVKKVWAGCPEQPTVKVRLWAHKVGSPAEEKTEADWAQFSGAVPPDEVGAEPWTYELTNQPQFSADGTKLEYSITEDQIEGCTASYSYSVDERTNAKTFTVTNRLGASAPPTSPSESPAPPTSPSESPAPEVSSPAPGLPATGVFGFESGLAGWILLLAGSVFVIALGARYRRVNS